MRASKKIRARKRKEILQDRVLALMGFDFGDEFNMEKAEALHEDFIKSLDGKEIDPPDLQQFLEIVISVSQMITNSAGNMEFRDDAELKEYMDNFFRNFNSNRNSFSFN